MPVTLDLRFAGLAILGLVAGIWLLLRGFGAYRRAARIGDIATSTISSIAVGEVRVSGIVERAELELLSPIQSRPCIYYRSRIDQRSGDSSRVVFREERSVGFRVRDDSGSVRVFARGAAWDVPNAYDEHTGMFGEEPMGLEIRHGPALRIGAPTREMQVADLLTVRPMQNLGLPDQASGGGGLSVAGVLGLDRGIAIGVGSSGRSYEEARLTIGDAVTIVGTVLPFGSLEDPVGADEEYVEGLGVAGDPEVAADLAEARAAGILADDPAEAWGNAAIPGFGIGTPVRPPELDPGARPLPAATAEEAARIERTFDIAPDDLVLAARVDAPLLVAAGTPGTAAARSESQFLVGLCGAVLSIISSVALAVMIAGGQK